MASSKDNMEGTVFFKWTDEYEKIFCELCIKFIRKNGRVSFKWKEINQEFEALINRKCICKTLKNKYDSMKKDWCVWKFLKFGETGLGWDPATGRLSCSDEWWDRKIKEKPEAKKFRSKSIDPSIEEYWNQLFEDTYAIGENVVAPSMDPNFVLPSDQLNVEEEDKESGEEENNYHEIDGDQVYAEYTRYASQLYNEENSFWPNFANEVDGTQVPNQDLRGTQETTQGPIGTQVPRQGVEGTQVGNDTRRTTQTQNITNKPISGKRKRSQSGGATKLSSQIETMISQSNKALEMMQSDDNGNKNDASTSTIPTAMTIINRMVGACLLEKGSELWCFAAYLIESDAKREIFLNMEDDESRKVWLTYMHGRDK